ncbi:MAG: hypothetical protein AB8G18_12680 [Gammaproteobacteria bacterium]
MNKWLVVFLAGLVGVLGFGLGRWTSSETQSASSRMAARSQSSTLENYTLTTEPPAYSESEAQDHRASNYTELQRIDDILDLPGDFAQTEALYAVAGRANQAELEELIQQSIDIVNRYDRSAALSILFGRYAELDPSAAVDYLVAIHLDVDNLMFRQIFDAWAKVDVSGAITKANQLVNRRQRNLAGNAILAVTARTNESLLEKVASDLDGHYELAHLRSEAIAIRANRDPQRALQEALAMDGMQGRWSAISRVATVWARNDPAGAMQALEQISDGQIRKIFLTQVLDRWVTDDPQQAMQFINAYPEGANRNEMLQHSLGAYAKENPQEALAAALQLNGRYRSSAVIGVATQWVTEDSQAALSNLMAIEDKTLRQQAISMVSMTIARQGADKAIEWLDSFDSESRIDQLSNVLSQVAQTDARRALEYVMNNVTGSKRDSTLQELLLITSRSDLTVTQDYLAQLGPSAETSRLYQQLAGQMANEDSSTAFQWVSTLSGAEKSNALKGIANALARSEPDQASSIIHQLSATDSAELIQGISRRLSYRDPEGAISWLEQFRGHASFKPAMSKVAMTMAAANPQRSLDIAAMLGGTEGVEITSVALSKWADKNPLAAASWAAGSDSSVRAAALNSVTVRWAKSDPARASGWVFSLPAGDGKNRALMSLAQYIPPNINELANVVSSISSDNMRQQSIRQTWSRLRNQQQDERAARAFLDEVGADQALINSLQPGGG